MHLSVVFDEGEWVNYFFSNCHRLWFHVRVFSWRKSWIWTWYETVPWNGDDHGWHNGVSIIQVTLVFSTGMISTPANFHRRMNFMFGRFKFVASFLTFFLIFLISLYTSRFFLAFFVYKARKTFSFFQGLYAILDDSSPYVNCCPNITFKISLYSCISLALTDGSWIFVLSPISQ